LWKKELKKRRTLREREGKYVRDRIRMIKKGICDIEIRIEIRWNKIDID